MTRCKVYKWANTVVLLFLISAFVHHSFLSETTSAIFVTKQKNSLLKEIENRAVDFEEAPKNAYIDRVWKKTPGRNGIKVDITKSYENMKKAKEFDATKLIFKEIPPDVTLSDLPPSPIYRGHPEKDMVALLINVSWGTEYIPRILQVLNKYQVRATFFIEGKWAKENKEMVEMIMEQNHLIGNHAYNHPDMATLSEEDIRKQIEDTNDILEAITQERPKFFAPPSGSFNDKVVKIAFELEMETILWTVDTIDWKNPSVSVMMNRVMNNIHPGATILMHPTEPVAQGLEQMIEQIKQNNYELHTIEKLLSEER